MPVTLALLDLENTLPEHLDRIDVVFFVRRHSLQFAVRDPVSLYQQFVRTERLQVDQIAHLPISYRVRGFVVEGLRRVWMNETLKGYILYIIRFRFYFFIFLVFLFLIKLLIFFIK
jgi:hypothetical protein